MIRCRRHHDAEQDTCFFRRHAPALTKRRREQRRPGRVADASATASCRIAAPSGRLFLLIDACKEILPVASASSRRSRYAPKGTFSSSEATEE
ncbi:hypothetical protein MTO96_025146 [Rhipicephalus appendiculatus]